MTDIDPSVFPSKPETPKLVPVFVMNFKLKEPEPVFSNPELSKALTLATVVNGEIKTVKNELGLEFDVSRVVGYDNLTSDLHRDVTLLDCRCYGRLPNGKGVYIKYPGVVHNNEPTVNVQLGKTKTSTFEEGYVTCNPSFEFDGGIEDKYRWVLRENFIGKGRFVRGNSNDLYVQYYIYILR
ncbi:uncharacterized protein PRCAT00003910001 [Priceomyces carsonii]|uniref:uncharacterized protein n=1 Tax=Priceomyces carsonii TaxID=28549 RepID=UPI002ED94F00|nr:unnamed protein product [Priceomyces carsonii]